MLFGGYFFMSKDCLTSKTLTIYNQIVFLNCTCHNNDCCNNLQANPDCLAFYKLSSWNRWAEEWKSRNKTLFPRKSHSTMDIGDTTHVVLH